MDSINNMLISYKENTREERKILRFADNFIRQFTYLYPDKPKPPLYMKNECDVKKLICTFLCPLKISMPVEMRKWNLCTNFFAEYFDYEVLPYPTAYPEKLPSIDNILKKRTGNSLELSIVLCTFLLAANYDAYVIQGYARKNICEKLKDNDTEPIISFHTDSEYHKLYFTSTESGNKPVVSKYELNFEQAKSFWMEDKKEFHFEDNKENVEEFEKDELLGKRIHFWIVICSYENNSLNPFFVEPTTGAMKSVDDFNYLGIEFAWNNRNFWFNKQISKLSCKNLNFNVNDCTKWEVFLPDNYIEGGYKKLLRMPQSWIRYIEIRREDLNRSFPENGRHIYYKRAIVEKYNINALKNGLVYQITYFRTEKKNNALERRAFYAGREDLMEYRKTDFENNFIEDVFAAGRIDALKSHKYPLQKLLHFPQTLMFYYHMREDRLSCRVWDNACTADEFVDRLDLLSKREVHFSRDVFQCSTEFTVSHELAGNITVPLITDRTKKASTDNVDRLENIQIPSEETSRAEIQNSSSTDSMKDSTPDNGSKGAVTLDETSNGIEVRTTSCKDSESENAYDSKSKESVTVDHPSLKDSEQEVIPNSKSKEALRLGLGPESFDSANDILEGVNFNTWTLEWFLENIDPAERYATSESESDEPGIPNQRHIKKRVKEKTNGMKAYSRERYQQNEEEPANEYIDITDKNVKTNDNYAIENNNLKLDDQEEYPSEEAFDIIYDEGNTLDEMKCVKDLLKGRDQQGENANDDFKEDTPGNISTQNYDMIQDAEKRCLSKGSEGVKQMEEQKQDYIRVNDENGETGLIEGTQNNQSRRESESKSDEPDLSNQRDIKERVNETTDVIKSDAREISQQKDEEPENEYIDVKNKKVKMSEYCVIENNNLKLHDQGESLSKEELDTIDEEEDALDDIKNGIDILIGRDQQGENMYDSFKEDTAGIKSTQNCYLIQDADEIYLSKGSEGVKQIEEQKQDYIKVKDENGDIAVIGGTQNNQSLRKSESESDGPEISNQRDIKEKVNGTTNGTEEYAGERYQQKEEEPANEYKDIKDKNVKTNENYVIENNNLEFDDEEESSTKETFNIIDDEENTLDEMKYVKDLIKGRDQQNENVDNFKDDTAEVKSTQNYDMIQDAEKRYVSKGSEEVKEMEEQNQKCIKVKDENGETGVVEGIQNSDPTSYVEEGFVETNTRKHNLDSEEEEEEESNKEKEIYDEINFDALSDEESEVDYQLFLSKLWNEYVQIHNKEIFYITREFLQHKNLRETDILNLKRKIIRKRRRNVIYFQRMESGKPSVRIYKKKMDEISESQENVFTNDLISHLKLKEIIGDKTFSSIPECHTMDLEAIDEEAVNAEIIKKETLKILDRELKENGNRRLNEHNMIIKQTYELDISLPVEQDIENEWFDFESNCYRLDFHYSKNLSSRKILLFTKPECGITDFNFCGYLKQEILPCYETKHTKKCQLYSYLVALMKKEPIVLREHARFEKEMESILKARHAENDSSDD